MKPELQLTARIQGETRSASMSAYGRGWQDAEGNLWRVVKATHHFVGGASYYLELTFDGWEGAAFEETDTNFDPGTDYGTPDDPPITYEFSGDEVTDEAMQAYLDGLTPSWSDWSFWFEEATDDPEEVHAFGDYNFPSPDGERTFTRNDPELTLEGEEGFRQAGVTLIQPRVRTLTPRPCVVTWDNIATTADVPLTFAGGWVELDRVSQSENGTAPGTLAAIRCHPWTGA